MELITRQALKPPAKTMERMGICKSVDKQEYKELLSGLSAKVLQAGWEKGGEKWPKNSEILGSDVGIKYTLKIYIRVSILYKNNQCHPKEHQH